MESSVLRPRPAVRPASAAVALSAPFVLALLVSGSFVARFLVALRRATPDYFPDEYTYSSLARGLAQAGRPLIRGGPAHFPALLEPLLAAPFWLFGDPQLALRLTQAENALLMSLAAIPVYLLCRQLELGRWFSYTAAAIALATPNLLYTGYLLADPVAYPLALWAIYAGVRLLAEPSRRRELAFFTASVLSAFARIEYLALPAVLLGASLVVERGRVREVARKLPLSFGLFGVPAATVAALGPSRVLGAYGGALHQHVHAGALLRWAGSDALLLGYSAGVVLVPGALLGVGYALARPRARVEAAFGAVAAGLALALVAQSAFVSAFASGRFGERYLIVLPALAAPAFGVYARRRGTLLPTALLGAAVVGLAARFPLSGYATRHLKTDSTFLIAVAKLEELAGTVNGSLALSVTAASLAAVAVLVGIRPARRVSLALGLTLAFVAAGSAAATSAELDLSRLALASSVPADARWVDGARLGSVALLQTPGGDGGSATEHLFWNTSLRRVLLLPGSARIDRFAASHVTIGGNGTLLAGGRTVRQPLLVQGLQTRLGFAGARRVGSGGTFQLWRPSGVARLAYEAVGLSFDGWLAPSGSLTVWPALPETLVLSLSLPRGVQPQTITLTGPRLTRSVRLEPGMSRRVVLAVPPGRRWSMAYRSDRFGVLPDGRAVSARARLLFH